MDEKAHKKLLKTAEHLLSARVALFAVKFHRASQSKLQGIDFPKSKQGLINLAEEHDAPEVLINFLDKLPDKVYQSMIDVEQEVGAKK